MVMLSMPASRASIAATAACTSAVAKVRNHSPRASPDAAISVSRVEEEQHDICITPAGASYAYWSYADSNPGIHEQICALNPSRRMGDCEIDIAGMGPENIGAPDFGHESALVGMTPGLEDEETGDIEGRDMHRDAIRWGFGRPGRSQTFRTRSCGKSTVWRAIEPPTGPGRDQSGSCVDR